MGGLCPSRALCLAAPLSVSHESSHVVKVHGGTHISLSTSSTSGERERERERERAVVEQATLLFEMFEQRGAILLNSSLKLMEPQDQRAVVPITVCHGCLTFKLKL